MYLPELVFLCLWCRSRMVSTI